MPHPPTLSHAQLLAVLPPNICSQLGIGQKLGTKIPRLFFAGVASSMARVAASSSSGRGDFLEDDTYIIVTVSSMGIFALARDANGDLPAATADSSGDRMFELRRKIPLRDIEKLGLFPHRSTKSRIVSVHVPSGHDAAFAFRSEDSRAVARALCEAILALCPPTDEGNGPEVAAVDEDEGLQMLRSLRFDVASHARPPRTPTVTFAAAPTVVAEAPPSPPAPALAPAPPAVPPLAIPRPQPVHHPVHHDVAPAVTEPDVPRQISPPPQPSPSQGELSEPPSLPKSPPPPSFVSFPPLFARVTAHAATLRRRRIEHDGHMHALHALLDQLCAQHATALAEFDADAAAMAAAAEEHARAEAELNHGADEADQRTAAHEVAMVREAAEQRAAADAATQALQLAVGQLLDRRRQLEEAQRVHPSLEALGDEAERLRERKSALLQRVYELEAAEEARRRDAAATRAVDAECAALQVELLAARERRREEALGDATRRAELEELQLKCRAAERDIADLHARRAAAASDRARLVGDVDARRCRVVRLREAVRRLELDSQLTAAMQRETAQDAQATQDLLDAARRVSEEHKRYTDGMNAAVDALIEDTFRRRKGAGATPAAAATTQRVAADEGDAAATVEVAAPPE
jgi:hypothetical protein